MFFTFLVIYDLLNHMSKLMKLKAVLHQPNTDDQTFQIDLIQSLEDVPLVEFMYLVFTRMPGESYRRRLRSLLYLCYVFGALINSLVC